MSRPQANASKDGARKALGPAGQADWRLHEARQNPVDVIQRLIDELGRVPTEVLIDSAAALSEQLVELERLVNKFKKITAAAQE